MKPLSIVLLHYAALSLHWHNLLIDFGAMANLDEWSTPIKSMLVQLGQNMDKDNGLDKLEKRLTDINEMVKSMPRSINAFHGLNRRLIRPLHCAMRNCEQLQKGTDCLGRIAQQQYLDSVMPKMQSILWALSAEFGTFIVEHELDRIYQERLQGNTNLTKSVDNLFKLLRDHPTCHCTAAALQWAKQRLDQFSDRHAIEEIFAVVKLSILETEIEVKIPEFAKHPVDAEALLEFSRDFHAEWHKNIRPAINELPDGIKENVQQKFKTLSQTAQRLSAPIIEELVQKLDELTNKFKQSLEMLRYDLKPTRPTKKSKNVANPSNREALNKLDLSKTEDKHKVEYMTHVHNFKLFQFGAVQQQVEEQKKMIRKAFVLSKNFPDQSESVECNTNLD
uniref:Uncharacterized protein n=1 Tax=Globodera rostochiensis TaxID=31243 RepID=A0A914HG87_GLORO